MSLFCINGVDLMFWWVMLLCQMVQCMAINCEINDEE